MKKLLFLFFLAVCYVAGYAQHVIDPLLSEEMSRRNDDEKITVVVIMKSRYDQAQLTRRADHFVVRADRREFVVNELKAFAEASQYDLKRTLSEMERGGMVSEPTVLWMANALYFDATKAAVEALALRNDIEIIGYAIERNWIPDGEEARPASASREITPNVTKVGADQVWALGYTGQGVVVAVIDTGVNYNHLDVADHLWDGGEAFPYHGYDVKNHDNNPMDDNGHGSHCAGTVLGDGTAGSQTGMAPDATLMCVKCLDSSGNGGAQSISEGIQWAVEHGCDLFSMSLGIPNSSITERTLLRHTCVAALDAGIVGAIAAGNEGDKQWQYPIPNNVRVPGSCPPPYMDDVQRTNPGELSCSVCIGAVDYNDNAANFTSNGPVTWTNTEFGDYEYNTNIGLIRPDVCAPGVGIKSLRHNNNNGYTVMSGTSMATPCVAGCMALMLSKDINLSPSEICRILEETAVPLDLGKSNVYGFGRVNVLDAMALVVIGDIKYNAFEINDVEGNNNHKLNPGETVGMSLTLDNITDHPVTGVSVVLTTDNAHVTLIDNQVDFPDFAANQTLTVENAFTFSVDDEVTAKQQVKFHIEINVDGENTGRFLFNVDVYDYLMQFGAIEVINDDNDNGILEPGENADLRIFIDNAGNEMAQNLDGVLSSDYQYLNISQAEMAFGTVGAGLMAYADFNVTLDAAAPANVVLPFALELTDIHGKQTDLEFQYKKTCTVIFSLADYYYDGWNGAYLYVEYSDGTPAEQMTIDNGSYATYTRELASNSTVTLTWHSGNFDNECSFEIKYDDGTVIYQNSGGMDAPYSFVVNCSGGGEIPNLCNPIQNLDYELVGHDVVLTWDVPRGFTPTGYEVYRETQLLATVEDALTYTDPDMEDGLYNYCVYAVYDGCQSEYVCIEVKVLSCSPILNLDYSLNDDLLLTLIWDEPEIITGLIEYQVYMDEELVGTTNELTYAFTIAEGTHNINVKAVFETCETASFVTVCVVGAVENLDYLNMEGHHVQVVWNPIEGVGEYEVYLNGVLAATVGECAYMAEFESGVTKVMVKAVSEGCYVIGTSVEVCIVDAVENLSYTIDDRLVTVTWDPVEGVSQYEVFLDDILAETVDGTAYTAEFAAGLTTVTVKAALQGCYLLGASIEVCVCYAVENLTFAKMDEAGMLHFDWDDMENVDYYEITYNGTTEQTPCSDVVFEAVEGENTLCVTAHSIYGCSSEPVCLTQNVCAAVDGFDYSYIGNKVFVTWNGDAESYHVRLDGEGQQPETVEEPLYSAVLEGSHFIVVTPVHDECIAYTARFDFYVVNVAPVIRITDIQQGHIDMAWTMVDNATAYNLYRDGELIAEGLMDQAYIDTDMAINARHWYAVQTVFDKGVSDLSEEVGANYFADLDENDGKAKLFPNPTTDKVTVECVGMTMVEVYSVEGKLIQRFEVENNVCQIDGLESGIYTVRILKGDEVLARKVIKR